jgi:hypothetical protein
MKNEMKINGKYTFSDGYHLQKRMGESFSRNKKLLLKNYFGLINQEQII